MSVDPLKEALEAQKRALEIQKKMQENVISGELDSAQMASEYMKAMASIMPDMSALQGMSSFDQNAATLGGLGGFEDDDEDDTDYNNPDNLNLLCDYIAESLDALLKLSSSPALQAAENDSKWLQMGILCSGILSNLNGHNLDDIYVEEPNDGNYVAQIKEGLQEWWGIENREDLLGKLTWLSEGGHRKRYAAFCKAKAAAELINNDMDKDEQADTMRGFLFAKRFKNVKKVSDMLGWDLGRSALLIRYGFYVSWLSKDEANSMLIKLAKTLGGTYGSWQEFGASYQFGAAFWKVMGDPCSAKENNENIADAVSELLTSDMFGTVGEWSTFQWMRRK